MKHFDFNYLAHSNQAKPPLNEATKGEDELQSEEISKACQHSLQAHFTAH
jgi:hypothetical protein